MAPPAGRKNRPVHTNAKIASPERPPDYNAETPKFCLTHLQPDFDVEALDAEGRAAFATALHKRSKMTWTEILRSPRHGLGSENIPVSQLKVNLPVVFEGQEKVLVLRYHGKLPMAGVRVNDVYHLLWLEPEFNTLYDHG